MKIAIVGWGIEGKSAYKYFGSEHEYLIVNEQPLNDFPRESEKVKVQFLSAKKPAGVTGNVQDLSYLNGIDEYEKIIYTPTSRKNLEKVFGNDSSFWQKATTAEHIFFENVKTKNIVGITGTKGKGTTTTLIAKMLEAAGKKVYVGGNIGNSVLEFMDEVQPDDWVILEIANFQLYKFPYSPHVAVCLMLMPEHLDWHDSMEEYVEAKSNIFRHQNEQDFAIFFANNEISTSLAQYSNGKKIPYFASPGARIENDKVVIGDDSEEVISIGEIRLLGSHNLQNACAAVTAVWQIIKDINAIRQVLISFSGLEHRLEFVREFNGVKYYDDSFGTTPSTAIVAMQAFTEPKIMILGGSDKGIPFDKLADEVTKQNVKHVIAIGQTGAKIAELLQARNFQNITLGLNTMAEIINKASEIATAGDIVLLSTACASFGLFKDYKDRGNQFKACVNNLA